MKALWLVLMAIEKDSENERMFLPIPTIDCA